MARKYFAPQHRLGVQAKFIPIDDEAWNHEITGKALLGLGQEHEGVSLDPLYRYLMGLTRFDLGAGDLREVIEATKCLDLTKAEIWHLRPLPTQQRIAVLESVRLGEDSTARLTAFVHAVMKFENAPNAFGEALAKVIDELPKARTARDIDRLMDSVMDYAYDVWRDVGWAAIKLSQDLLEDEQKN